MGDAMTLSIFGPVPYFKCKVGREYLDNMNPEFKGQHVDCVAYGVRCVRGHSLWFQVMLTSEGFGGITFLVPINALSWGSEMPQLYIQPWDVFSEQFTVARMPFVEQGKVSVLPDRVPGRYLFTIDFIGSDLAEDVEQHKHLHVVRFDTWIGAFPNNRILWHDPAFWKTTETIPKLSSLDREFRAE